MEPQILSLFSFYPRRVGIPSKVINSPKEFLSYYKKYCYSLDGAHTSIYDITQTPYIDKVLFEFDSKDIRESFEEVVTLVDELESKNYPYYAIFSGTKGFHVYLLLKPAKYNLNTAKFLLREFVSPFLNDFKTLDTTKTGCLSTIRIPNSRNKIRFAVPLPYDFVDWNLDCIITYANRPRPFPELPTASFRRLDQITKISKSVIKIEEEDDEFIEFNYLPLKVLKPLLRPCTYKYIQTPNPRHIVRFNFVAELRELGVSKSTVFKIIKSLNWEDFDPNLTMYYIKYIYDKKYKPYSCEKTSQYIDRELCRKCRGGEMN